MSLETTSRLVIIGLGLSLAAPTSAPAAEPICEERTPLQRPIEYHSLETLADGRIIFRLCAPRSQDATLLGSEIDGIPNGLDGKPAGLPMAKDAQGYWALTTPAPVPAGLYRYAFKIGGVQLPDPQGTSPTLDFRGVRSVFEVKGAATAFQSYRPEIAHGVVSTIDLPSSTLGTLRRAHIYTPPGYERGGNRRYPVLYLVHGAGDSDDSWTSVGHAQYILDNLIADGKAVPMIVVMPFGHTPDRPGVERMINTDFGTDLIKDVIPFIDAHFRTQPTADRRSMAGLSMGGAHTLNFGLTHPEIFGSVGIFSMGLYTLDFATRYRAMNDANLKRRAAAPGLVYYAIGRDDFLYASVAPTRKMLDDYKIRYAFRETPGGHTWINWREYLNDFAPKLFR